MRLPTPLVDGILEERENRFRARVRLPGGNVLAHVPNPGRTVELLYPGAHVLLTPRPESGRRTTYDLILAYTADNVLVSLDTRFPSRADYVAACSALVRREAIERTGLFPDNFIYYDDVDWCVRMRLATGLKSRACVRSRAYHPPADRRFATWTRYYI